MIVLALVYFDITEGFDQSVVLFVSENVGNPVLDIVMQSITESGDTFYMLGFGVITLLIKKTRRIGITLNCSQYPSYRLHKMRC
jgi:undecaprenyl-diphosphatase